MIGSTISHYKIIEKLGEGEPTTLQKMELRRPGLTTLQKMELRRPGPVRRSSPPKSSFDVGGPVRRSLKDVGGSLKDVGGSPISFVRRS